jgi:tRNA (mo5U34)-methyltransferase
MAASLAEKVKEIDWYHALELPGGVVTDGWFDLRPYVDLYGLPERMDGMRALEVGTWDGFWAFEMERRGAEVVALDVEDESQLDWPPRRRPKEFKPIGTRGEGFKLAHEALGSKVERVIHNIYEAKPEDLGTFDLVFCGSVLIHLRDQLLALERIANLCSGKLISAEEYNRAAGLVPFPVSRFRADRDADVVFWQPSARTWRRMMWTAGFDEVKEVARFDMRARDFSVRHVINHATKSRTG